MNLEEQVAFYNKIENIHFKNMVSTIVSYIVFKQLSIVKIYEAWELAIAITTNKVKNKSGSYIELEINKEEQ